MPATEANSRTKLEKEFTTYKEIRKKKRLIILQIFSKNCTFAAVLINRIMEFTGKIIAILPPRGGVSKAGNEWKVQEFVIEDHGQYPRRMCFEVFGNDKIEQFNIQMNEELTVSFDIDARQWQDRWFNSIRAWKVERVNATANAPMPDPAIPPMAPTTTPEFTPNDSNDDLPF